jgi:RNA polymerase sigma-70 factor (ECF subfamily)
MDQSDASTRSARDERLVHCMQQIAEHRDRQAFSELFDHFMPLVRSYSLARDPGAHSLADDLAQDVMIRVWDKAHTFRPDMGQVSTWVFTLARNSRIDRIRRSSRYVTQLDPEDVFSAMEAPGLDPFQLAQQRQVENAISENLRKLPVEQAQVLGKVYLEGKTQQETADELGIALGTVKSRTRLALQKMQLLLRGQ